MRVENFMMPALRILDPNEGKLKYYYEGDVKNMTIADIKKFVGDFKTGNIRPWFASDEAPDTNTTDGLTVVVGKTWSDIVNDPEKDVLVKYYAPWCGNCKDLEPIWKDIAKDAEQIEDLVVAEFNVESNEVKGLMLDGYPTLKLYPKHDKSGQMFYRGEKKFFDIQMWLYENSDAYRVGKDK